MNIANYHTLINVLYIKPHLSNFVREDIKIILTEKEFQFLFKEVSEVLEPINTITGSADEDMDDIIVVY